MKTEEFTEWLRMMYPETTTTVRNRLSNCRNIEKYYGNLDIHFDNDKFNTLLSDLTYSVDNERNQVPPKHNIPIAGNIRTGSATLKQSVKLYKEFRLFLEEAYPDFVSGDSKEETNDDIRNQLFVILSKFNYDGKKYQDVGVLQVELKDYLSVQLTDFSWEMEYKPSDKYRDSIDIFGNSKVDGSKIIIELDAHRADQVAKKFISRFSLFINENLLYVSLCYPGTNNMSKQECLKYFQYCELLSNFISQNTIKKKQYIGYCL